MVNSPYFMSLGLVELSLLGCLSPLLTFAYLWQLKEWRWDRLLEHFRREGLGSLYGRARPWILFLGILLVVNPRGNIVIASLVTTTLFGLLSSAQILLQRQPKPVWTKKAVTLMGTAFALDVVFALLHINEAPWHFYSFVALWPLFQPLVLAFAWLLWKPVDLYLKQRILTHARLLREKHPELTVIGVTGSVGKTTTKELLACVLKPLGAVATPAYVNSEMGVAQWLSKILALAPSPNPLIVEMGAYRPGEIALLCRIAKPSIGVVTFVGTQHLALFGSKEKLWEAKSELVRSLPSNGLAVLNGDNEDVLRMKSIAPCPVNVVSTGGTADVEAYEIEETMHGIRFKSGNHKFEVKLHGTHNVTNVLLTIAVARHLGMKDDAIARELAHFSPPKQTFEVRTEHGVTILDDTHNSSPASVKAAIGWAKGQPFDCKVLLMAGLIELGEETERAHRELGAAAAEVFDRVIFLDRDLAKLFEAGFGKPTEALSKTTEPVPSGTLLCCIGRMTKSTIDLLLLPSQDQTRAESRTDERRDNV